MAFGICVEPDPTPEKVGCLFRSFPGGCSTCHGRTLEVTGQGQLSLYVEGSGKGVCGLSVCCVFP